jgi:hypothetical protein
LRCYSEYVAESRQVLGFNLSWTHLQGQPARIED